MTDIVTKEQRSRNMAAIHSKNTKPEIYFRKLLFAVGFRYRTNSGEIPGRPDVFLRKYHTAVFIHGCYWHRHSGCQYAYMPKSNVEFWQRKFDDNVRRDIEVQNILKQTGIKCLIVWECTIRRMMHSKELEHEVLMRTISFFREEDFFLEL